MTEHVSKSIQYEMDKIEYRNTKPLDDSDIERIFVYLKKMDVDLSPLLSIIHSLVISHIDSKFKTMIMKRIMKYYGINNPNTLECRHKYIVEEGVIVKTPFLIGEKKELINILLKELNLDV
jgi:hypothetical protein